MILHNLHSSSSGGHMGINQTTTRAKERFFGPPMQESIQIIIQNFSECNQTKSDPTVTKAPLKQIEVSEPFVFWVMDYMGLMKETAGRKGSEGYCSPYSGFLHLLSFWPSYIHPL